MAEADAKARAEAKAKKELARSGGSDYMGAPAASYSSEYEWVRLL